MVENPCIELGEDRCKFYTDTQNSKLYGHCLIYDTGLNKIQKAKDRFGVQITEEQIAWFNQNCIDYPSTEDIEAGYTLPPECSFSFEVAVDG